MTRRLFILLILCCLQTVLTADAATKLDEDVLARWNNVNLTVDDLRAYMVDMSSIEKATYISNKNKVTLALIDLFKRKGLSEEAESQGLKEQQTYKYKLKNASDTILIEMLQKHYLEALPDADYASMAYEEYLANKESYTAAEQREVSHILLKHAEDNDIKGRIEDIHNKIVDGRITFEQAALQYSEDDVSASKQGELGMLSKGETVRQFEAVAFNLSEGEISAPVQTQFGWHIIKVNKIEPEYQKTYDQVKNSLIKQAESRYKQSKWLEYVDEISVDEEAPIINEDLLQGLINELTSKVINEEAQ